MHPYRIFISYSHDDYELAEKVVDHLKSVGFNPTWDRNLRPGDRFSEAIRHGIAHAHVFLPILTRNSVKRPWVHQETGYAMGMDIPVLPVAIGQVPGQMIQELHAIQIGADMAGLLQEELPEAVSNLLANARKGSEAAFQCASVPEERTELLARYTKEALLHNASGPLRQAGAMTSFALPNQPSDHEIWQLRDATVQRSQLLHDLHHEERLAMEGYARKNGCDLVIWPHQPMNPYSPEAVRVRLTTLLEFLEDPSVEKVRVVVKKPTTSRNLIMAGDWFTAETVAPRPGQGYFQTIFTWHAPTVLEKVSRFDRDFENYLRSAGLGLNDDSSREAGIREVMKALGSLENSLSVS